MPDWPVVQAARREDTLEQVLLRQIRDALVRIEKKLSVQADEWVLCPVCHGRGETLLNAAPPPHWDPCWRCAKLGRVRKENTDV